MTRKLLAVLLVLVSAQSSFAQHGTRDGAVLGGIGGAAIGGIIGHQNKETTEGVLIGGAVGAVAGGLIGNQRDQQMARERYYQQQAWQAQNQRRYTTYQSYPTQQTIVTPAVTTPGVTMNDILSMTRGGVSESIVINHIYTNGVQRRPTSNEVVSMFQQGVSENIINAMQQAPVRGGSYVTSAQPSVVVTRPATTVVVEEPVPVYAPPPMSRPTYYAPYPHTHRRGF